MCSVRPIFFPTTTSAATRRRPRRSSTTATCSGSPASAAPFFVCPTAHGYDNRVILDAIAKLGDSARGIANIDASFEANSLAALAEGGIRGARFHLMKDRPGSEDHLGAHLPALQRLGWILVLHVDPPDFIEHERFIGRSRR